MTFFTSKIFFLRRNDFFYVKMLFFRRNAFFPSKNSVYLVKKILPTTEILKSVVTNLTEILCYILFHSAAIH